MTQYNYILYNTAYIILLCIFIRKAQLYIIKLIIYYDIIELTVS